MRDVLKAGGLYFTLVFGAGFVLGTVRVLAVAPRLGELGAVALELPLMLAASWIGCGVALHRVAVPPGAARLGMGLVAFALLMVAETVLSMALGRTLAEHLASYKAAPGLMGLGGQLVFALLPRIRR